MADSIWVLLADPDDFGWRHLVEQGTAVWDGIRNRQAQNNLARCRPGDTALVYHTAPDKALIGVARIASEPRQDAGDPERVVVDVEPVRALDRPLPLAELKGDALLATMSFVRMPRVAVQPVTAEQYARVLELSGSEAD